MTRATSYGDNRPLRGEQGFAGYGVGLTICTNPRHWKAMQPESSIWRISRLNRGFAQCFNPRGCAANLMSMNPEMDPSVINCANCHSPMPKELRFCRNCGFRLGEGAAEYTETVRFQNGRPVNLANGAVSSHQPFATAYGGAMIPGAGRQIAKRRKRMSGMTWMFIGLLIFFLAAAAFTAIVAPIRRTVIPATSAPPRAYVGVSPFETGEGGVTFDNVKTPGAPADKAGLVGGDIITS